MKADRAAMIFLNMEFSCNISFIFFIVRNQGYFLKSGISVSHKKYPAMGYTAGYFI